MNHDGSKYGEQNTDDINQNNQLKDLTNVARNTREKNTPKTLFKQETEKVIDDLDMANV